MRWTWRAVGVVTALLGCSSGGASSGAPVPASAAAAMIDGQWSYRGAVPGTMALELELWAVGKSDSLGGRVVHWMAGDVGQDGRSLKLRGAVAPTGGVWFEIPLAASAMRIEGTVRGDTLVITKATTGGDDNGLSGGRFVRTAPLKKT